MEIEFSCYNESSELALFPISSLRTFSQLCENFRSICMLMTTKAWMRIENYGREVYGNLFCNFCCKVFQFCRFLSAIKSELLEENGADSLWWRCPIPSRNNNWMEGNFREKSSLSSQGWAWKAISKTLIAPKASPHESSIIRNRIKIKFPDMWNILSLTKRRGFFLI